MIEGVDGKPYGPDPQTERTFRDSDAPQPELTLNVIRGDVLTTHVLPTAGTVIIGRGSSAAIRIDDVSVSRHHASLHIGPELTIEELGSANGTRIGSRPLAPGTRCPLALGEMVWIGEVTIVVLPKTQRAAARPRPLWRHDVFEAQLEQECIRAGSGPGSFTVARLGVDASTAQAPVHTLLGKVLGNAHPVGEYGPGQYEILFPQLDATQAAVLVLRIAGELAALGITLHHGLAVYPTDGRSPESLIACACSRLSSAPGRTEKLDDAIVVRDPAMIRLYQLVERVAAGNLSVLLLGETGSGKEIVATAVHRYSPRAKQPFLSLNCASLSEGLLESELFGHEKGAFTGAVTAKPGLLESADGGTLFLDEIGEMPLALQAKLLRVLEERKVRRVGGIKANPIDVRLVSATNRDLDEEIARGHFRKDLFYRVSGIALAIPPLRDRPLEIDLLAQRFLERAARGIGLTEAPALSPAALDLLRRYPWPGNIRELRNVMERAVLICGQGGEITLEHLPAEKMSSDFPGLEQRPAPVASIGESRDDQLERRRVIEALELCAWNQTRAAKLLGMSRGTLVARLNKYNLPRTHERKSSD
jgi:DNA-binding NtrC family response regulator